MIKTGPTFLGTQGDLFQKLSVTTMYFIFSKDNKTVLNFQSVRHGVHCDRSGDGPRGGHQDHEPIPAAQEGAHYQRDSCHAGKPESQHRQLP